MKQNRKRYTQAIVDQQSNIQQHYNPFINQIKQNPDKKTTKNQNINQLKSCVTLFENQQEEFIDQFDYSFNQQVELNVMKEIVFNKQNNDSQENNNNRRDSNTILSRIITNTNKVRKFQMFQKKKQNYYQEQISFNTKFLVAYPQTPGFKNLLNSPFGKFNSLYKEIIQNWQRDTDSQNDYKNIIIQPLDIKTNPIQFYNKNKACFDAGRYFIGIAIKLKQMNYINESLYFCCLACFAQPLNSQTWKKYISFLQQQGKLSKACVLAKTGYLFTKNQQLAKNYYIFGQRSGIQLQKLQGLMCSISHPEAYQKTLLPQSAKLQIKYGKLWKGIKMLWQICKINDYKLPVCILTLFLARYLENIGYIDLAMSILKKSFSKSMSKLQIYLLYMEMSVRKNKYIVQKDLEEILKYLDCISGENRYRLWLQIAELLFKYKDRRYETFIAYAFQAAKQYCAPGAGSTKAIKQIYYTIAKLTKILPNVKGIASDTTIFQLNRHRFIKGQQLIQYQFQDWKYYLHYGVVQRYDLLGQAAKKWLLTGRIIAEWIHCLRLIKKPLEMLKIWRQKIDQVPKSGELWCQGGRIYAQLKQYKNAEQCFRSAMHFTPQYGDSFIEQLKLLLQESRFLEIQKLKKLFLVCQPFYGHVLSYLKLNHWQTSSITLNQVWQNALFEISQDLYNQANYQQSNNNNLFTAYPPYNTAYINKQTSQQRQWLFTSYEQMENKN